MQFDQLKRREFMTLLGGAAAWPLGVRAQPPVMPVIGFVNGAAPDTFSHLAAAFTRGLNEAGFIKGQNVAIDSRWAEGRLDRVPALVSDLVRNKVTVLVVTGPRPRGFNPALTTQIPIVATFGGDPVRLGYVRSINRPGKNLTGASIFASELETKRFGLLHEALPGAALLGVLVDPNFSESEVQLKEVQAAAAAMGQQIKVQSVGAENELESAFMSLVAARASGVALTGSPLFNNKRVQLAALARRHALPAISEVREFAEAGGLMSYGPRITDIYRQVGLYAGRILKGEKPADLPVVQPSKFDFLINLKTAKALGLEVPPMLLARADEVIE